MRARGVAAVAVVVAVALAIALVVVLATDDDDNEKAQAKSPATDQLASLKTAIAGYKDFKASQSDGFTTLVKDTKTGVSCIANGATGAMGQHYANGGRVADGLVEEERPEALLYEPQADGSKKLLGVEYVVIAADWNKTHTSPPSLFGKDFELTTTNPFGLPPFYALHAWTEQSNPSGTFSAWNPTVKCA
jgi:hypothetical protein